MSMETISRVSPPFTEISYPLHCGHTQAKARASVTPHETHSTRTGTSSIDQGRPVRGRVVRDMFENEGQVVGLYGPDDPHAQADRRHLLRLVAGRLGDDDVEDLFRDAEFVQSITCS